VIFSILYYKNGAPPPRTFNFIDMQNIKNVFVLAAGELMREDNLVPFFHLIFFDVDGNGGISSIRLEAVELYITFITWSNMKTTLFICLSGFMI
jgi:hypothetical protein